MAPRLGHRHDGGGARMRLGDRLEAANGNPKTALREVKALAKYL
jgi:hypothetical protein